MNVATTLDDTCRALDAIRGLSTATINRFIVGLDTSPVEMSEEEAAGQLGDSFAELLLRRGIFPRSGEELMQALNDASSDGDPLREQATFVLGEGSQISSAQGLSVRRNMRFLVTRGRLGSDGPDIVLSAPSPDAGFMELMAWDHTHAGFNYYRTVQGAWVWAANSRHALDPSSRGKGPFEAHPSGNLIMKELRLPWIHWHSFAANVLDRIFEPASPLAGHPWFSGKRGAEELETQVVMPSVTRWTKARFDAFPAGGPEGPRHLIEQVVSTPTVNLVSGKVDSEKARSEGFDIPPAFFADIETFARLGLAPPPRFHVAGATYTQALDTFEVRLSDGASFIQTGDTHFPFVVPERAFEDIETIRIAIERGILSDRFVACLLMTDFANPIFSARRASLIDHLPDMDGSGEGLGSLSETMAEAIVNAAAGAPDGGPEREFAERWAAEDSWKQVFNELLTEYYASIQGRLTAQEGFNDLFRLAESRRNRVRDMPIAESDLLFATTNLPDEDVQLNPDGSVRSS